MLGGAAPDLVFVDLYALTAHGAKRGLAPAERKTTRTGAARVAYRDPVGNEPGFGGAPVWPAGESRACT